MLLLTGRISDKLDLGFLKKEAKKFANAQTVFKRKKRSE